MRDFLGRMTAVTFTLCAASHADAAFLNGTDWFAAAASANTATVQLPAQSTVIRDYYGSYSPATAGQAVTVGTFGPPYNDPTATQSRDWLRPASTAAGQLGGNFGCFTPTFNCLGAHTITYTLPFAIIGLAGNLDLRAPTGIESLPFFELTSFGSNPSSSNPFRYTGFWGDTFAATDTLTIVWTPGLSSTDDVASFVLTNAQVLTAPGVVTIPEPVSAAVFGLGLLCLGAVRPGCTAA